MTGTTQRNAKEKIYSLGDSRGDVVEELGDGADILEHSKRNYYDMIST